MQFNDTLSDGSATWRVIDTRGMGGGNINISNFVTHSELEQALASVDQNANANVSTATRAMQDGNGRNIVNTYLTKAEFNSNFSYASGVIRALKSGFASDFTLDIEDPDSTNETNLPSIKKQSQLFQNRYAQFLSDDTFFKESMAHKMNLLFNICPNTRKYDNSVEERWRKYHDSICANGVDCVFLNGGKYVCTIHKSKDDLPITYLDFYTSYPGVVGRMSKPKITSMYYLRDEDWIDYTARQFSGRLTVRKTSSFKSARPFMKEDGTYYNKGLVTGQLIIDIPYGIKARLKLKIQNLTSTYLTITVGTKASSSFFATEVDNPLSKYEEILPNGSRIAYSSNQIHSDITEYELGELDNGRNYIDFFKYCNSLNNNANDESNNGIQVKICAYEITYTDANGNTIPDSNVVECGSGWTDKSSVIFVDRLKKETKICTDTATVTYFVNIVKFSDNAGNISYVGINDNTGLRGAYNRNNFYLNATHEVVLGTAGAWAAAETAAAYYTNIFIPVLADPWQFTRIYHQQTYAMDKYYEGYVFTTSTLTAYSYIVNPLTGAISSSLGSSALGTYKGEPYYTNAAGTAMATPKNGAAHTEMAFHRAYVPLVAIHDGYIHFSFNNCQTDGRYTFPTDTYDTPFFDKYVITFDKTGANGTNPNMTKIVRTLYRPTGTNRTPISSCALTDVTYTASTNAVTGGIIEDDIEYKQNFTEKPYNTYNIIDRDTEQTRHIFHNKLISNNEQYKKRIIVNMVIIDSNTYIILLKAHIFNHVEHSYGSQMDYFKLPYRQDWIDYYFEVATIDPVSKYMIKMTEMKPSYLVDILKNNYYGGLR